MRFLKLPYTYYNHKYLNTINVFYVEQINYIRIDFYEIVGIFLSDIYIYRLSNHFLNAQSASFDQNTKYFFIFSSFEKKHSNNIFHDSLFWPCKTVRTIEFKRNAFCIYWFKAEMTLMQRSKLKHLICVCVYLFSS